MSKVSVDLNAPSPYIESGGWIHRFKRKLSYKLAFGIIRRFKPNLESGTILEIGTGSGFFLSFCHLLIPGAKLHGIEYDERLLAETRMRAPFADCQQGNAEHFDFGSTKFDLIVSFQVIEHLYHPEKMLSQVRTSLKPNGLFIVTTPNLAGWGAKIMGEKWHGYRHDHVSLKSMSEWVEIIEAQGFKARYVRSTFFSGIPLMNRLPFGIVNWALLYLFGAWPWSKGEAFVGAFVKTTDLHGVGTRDGLK